MMNNEKICENKRADKVWLGKNILIILVYACLGGCFGIGSVKAYKLFQEFQVKVFEILGIFVPYANLFITAIDGLIVVCFYKKARKLYSEWDHENEEKITYIEKTICYAGQVNSYIFIFALFFFAAGFMTIKANIEKTSGITATIWLLGFIVAITFIIITQKILMDFYKEVNPEKQVSPLNRNIKWIDRCDEAEQLYIYKCSYKSLVTVNRACKLLWLICIFGMAFLNWGFSPIVVITILWIVSTFSYYMEANRIQKSYVNVKNN